MELQVLQYPCQNPIFSMRVPVHAIKVRVRGKDAMAFIGGELTDGAIWWASGAPGTHGKIWTQ
jgi:hypothetical protein